MDTYSTVLPSYKNNMQNQLQVVRLVLSKIVWQSSGFVKEGRHNMGSLRGKFTSFYLSSGFHRPNQVETSGAPKSTIHRRKSARIG